MRASTDLLDHGSTLGSHRCLALGGASESNNPLVESMHLMGAVLSYKRNTEIFGEDEPADYIYKVISGSVRT